MFAEVKIIAFEDIFHDEARCKGIYTDDYRKLSDQIMLDKQDMENLEIKDGQNVKLENEVNSIIVTAHLSNYDEPHPGIAFMFTSPWTYQLVKEDVCQNGRPDHIIAKVSPSDEETTKMTELLERITIQIQNAI